MPSKINIGDSWKDVTNTWVNVGDVWKPIVASWVNVGDSWKVVQSATPASSLLTDLVTCYEMNETSGTTCNDAHSTNDAAIGTDVTINQTGILDKAYQFTGYASPLTVTNNASWQGATTGLTWNCWMNNNSTGAAWMYLARPEGPGIQVMATYGTRVIWQLYDSAYSEVFSPETANGLISVDGTTWNMITFALTIGAGTDGIVGKIYVDGTLVTTASGTSANHFNPTSNFTLGSYPPESYYLIGKLDQVAKWNRALSSDDVAALYNSGSGLAYTSWT